MPKGQKKNIYISVETVENLMNCFSYISTTLEFWKLDKTYPGNLLDDVCINKAFFLDSLLKESVSRSHINDK